VNSPYIGWWYIQYNMNFTWLFLFQVTNLIIKSSLENIDLNVPQNSIVGIVGPNGSGKTTLLKMICGLSYPDEGEIYIDDKQLKKGELASSVGVVLGNPAFIDTMTGVDNLKYLASIQDKIGEQEIHEAMERVDLNPLLKTKVKDYSLGISSRR